MTKKKAAKVEKRGTEITYQKLPEGMIRVIDFSGFLSMGAIRRGYEPSVSEAYLDVGPTKTYRIEEILCVEDCGREYFLEPGDVMRKAEFTKIVSAVKRSGTLLHNLSIAVWEAPIKTIKI